MVFDPGGAGFSGPCANCADYGALYVLNFLGNFNDIGTGITPEVAAKYCLPIINGYICYWAVDFTTICGRSTAVLQMTCAGAFGRHLIFELGTPNGCGEFFTPRALFWAADFPEGCDFTCFILNETIFQNCRTDLPVYLSSEPGLICA